MPVFTLPQRERHAALLPRLTALIEHHRAGCPPYARILAATGHPPGRSYARVDELPYLPVRLFKTHHLASTATIEPTVLTSSGTTAARPSRVTLDHDARRSQRDHLAAALQAVLGPRRLPLLIIDTPTVVRDGRTSIRGATVLGMLSLGRDVTFACMPDGVPDPVTGAAFTSRHEGHPFVVFGFTAQLWTYLTRLLPGAQDWSDAVVLHSGGWKRLADQAVSPQRFRDRIREVTGAVRVHNFYGMVEQGGTIYLEGPAGDGLYCPDFADVLVRDPYTWQVNPPGVPGVIEVISTLPRSHPGHLLLTEDLGVIHGIDDGHWPGTRFSVLGRIPRAEPRGCSDTGPALDRPA